MSDFFRLPHVALVLLWHWFDPRWPCLVAMSPFAWKRAPGRGEESHSRPPHLDKKTAKLKEGKQILFGSQFKKPLYYIAYK
jgi:hypothetical protein